MMLDTACSHPVCIIRTCLLDPAVTAVSAETSAAPAGPATCSSSAATMPRPCVRALRPMPSPSLRGLLALSRRPAPGAPSARGPAGRSRRSATSTSPRPSGTRSLRCRPSVDGPARPTRSYAAAPDSLPGPSLGQQGRGSQVPSSRQRRAHVRQRLRCGPAARWTGAGAAGVPLRCGLADQERPGGGGTPQRGRRRCAVRGVVAQDGQHLGVEGRDASSRCLAPPVSRSSSRSASTPAWRRSAL